METVVDSARVLVAALAGSGLMAQRQSPPTGGFEMALSANGFQYVDDKGNIRRPDRVQSYPVLTHDKEQVGSQPYPGGRNAPRVGPHRAQLRRTGDRSIPTPDPSDGTRILVDRLWPRGVTKGRAMVHVWMKENAASPALRTWFGHAPVRWLEFRKQYAGELTANEAGVSQLASLAAAGPGTLLYACAGRCTQSRVVLADYMRKFPRRHPPHHNSHSERRLQGLCRSQGIALPGAFVWTGSPSWKASSGSLMHRIVQPGSL